MIFAALGCLRVKAPAAMAPEGGRVQVLIHTYDLPICFGTLLRDELRSCLRDDASYEVVVNQW